jgi:hypothetical protein
MGRKRETNKMGYHDKKLHFAFNCELYLNIKIQSQLLSPGARQEAIRNRFFYPSRTKGKKCMQMTIFIKMIQCETSIFPSSSPNSLNQEYSIQNRCKSSFSLS